MSDVVDVACCCCCGVEVLGDGLCRPSSLLVEPTPFLLLLLLVAKW